MHVAFTGLQYLDRDFHSKTVNPPKESEQDEHFVSLDHVPKRRVHDGSGDEANTNLI